MAISIKDVASMANVSISTVSRVINNAPNVNPEIKSRVLKAISALNYEPNRIAQSLSGSPLKTITIAAARSTNFEYTSIVLSSICEFMHKAGYQVILNYANDSTNEVEQCLSIVRSSMSQGIILLGSKVEDMLISKLYEQNIPFVVIGRVSNPMLQDKISQVDTNNIIDCKDAVKYLFSLNHKKIGCIHAALDYVVTKDRIDGFILAHKEAGAPIDHSLIVDGGYTQKDAYVAALELLSQNNRPTAIFATDDTKALACYRAAEKLGIKIPQELSIIGHNNYDFLDFISPPLTTINVPITDLGTKSAELLCEIIEKKDTCKKVVLETTLIERKSCCCI